MALMKCPDCGAMVSSRAAQCPRCGCPQSAFVESTPITHSAATDDTPITPYTPKYTSTTEPSPSPKKESGGSSKMIWILLAVVALGTLLFIAFSIYTDNRKKNTRQMMKEFREELNGKRDRLRELQGLSNY